MEDGSRQPTDRGGPSQGRSADLDGNLISWLAQLTHTDPARIRTAVEAERLRGLARRQTDENLTTRYDEADTLLDNRLRGSEEQLALLDRLDGLERTREDQFREFEQLAVAEQEAFQAIDGQQDASNALLDRIEVQREAVDRCEAELGRLYDSLEHRWTKAGDALNAQGIAVGEGEEARDLDRLRTLIADRRGALGRELDDLERRTEEAQAEQQVARARNEEAIARSEALQREIEALGTPSEDPQDADRAAGVAARLEALEAERSAADAKANTSEAALDRLGTDLTDLETRKETATRAIGALDNLVTGENSTINELQSIENEYHSTLRSQLRADDEIVELEKNIADNDDRIREYQKNIADIRTKIGQNQLQISNIEDEIQKNRDREVASGQEMSEMDRQKTELDKKIDQLLQTSAQLDSDALRRAIQQLPETLEDEIGTAPPTTEPQDPPQTQGDLRETRDRIEQLVVEAEEAGAEGMDAAASASILRASRDIGKILLRDAALLATLATVREASAYGIGASSDKTQQDLAALLIGLNFLPVAVKVGGLIYDTSASRPEEDRLVPTGKQYASVVTNTLMMIGATVAADKVGGGVAAQGPAAARALIIGLRDMANLFMPVTQNRRGDLLLNMRAVLGDNVAYSLYSQLTTILIALGLVHSGAGTQAIGLAGTEAAKEVGKYVAAYTAVELLETISYRAFNQYFDRIAQGLEPAMPGDPNASQGLQGIARFRAKVGFKLKHTFAEVRRQGTDVAHARQAFTYIVLLLGNVVSELTKDRSVKSQTLILAGAMFAATFAAYFPFVGLSEYAAAPARDRDEEAGNQ